MWYRTDCFVFVLSIPGLRIDLPQGFALTNDHRPTMSAGWSLSRQGLPSCDRIFSFTVAEYCRVFPVQYSPPGCLLGAGVASSSAPGVGVKPLQSSWRQVASLIWLSFPRYVHLGTLHRARLPRCVHGFIGRTGPSPLESLGYVTLTIRPEGPSAE